METSYKGFERSVYQNKCKRKSENTNTTNEHKYFLERNFVGVTRLFVLVCLNRKNYVKRFNKRHYLPKERNKNYNVIINEKNICDQLIDSDINNMKKLEK